MKNILIIATLRHAFPRIRSLSKYLSEFGWKPTILSPSDKNDKAIISGFHITVENMTRIITVECRGDIFWFWRKILKQFNFKTTESLSEQLKTRIGVSTKSYCIDLLMNYYQAIFAYPDTERTWKRPVLKASIDILKTGQFQAILSSSPFPTSHIIAAKLQKYFCLPWLADFRDPWSENHNYPYGSIRKRFDRILEARTLQNAIAITAASPTYAKKQSIIHKKSVRIITNGFDRVELNYPAVVLNRKFTISYTGFIYPGKQNPDKFFKALQNLIFKKNINTNSMAVNLFGPKQIWLQDSIINHNLEGVVKQYGIINRDESLNKQRESHVLLLLGWEDPNERGVYPLKFFEYLAAYRPILISGGYVKSDIVKLLSDTQSGNHAPTVENIETAIWEFYKEYKKTHTVSYTGNIKEIGKYSDYEVARKFADVLNISIGEF